jgi:urease accessory protein
MTLEMREEQSDPRGERASKMPLPADLVRLLAAPDQCFEANLTSSNVGRLDVRFAPIAGKTRLVHHSHAGPLYILQPIYTDTNYPEQVFLYTIQLGDGLVQGDRYFQNFTCEAGSAVHITSQSATKIFRMQEDLASQRITLHLHDHAFVEYLPDPVIPFRDSRCYQRIMLTIAPASTLILGEILLPGRVAHGERHVYTLYRSDLEARRPDGVLLFADRMHFMPQQTPLRSPGRLGGYDVLGSLYFVTQQMAARELVQRLRICLAAHTDVLVGVSELPNACGVFVRMLGLSSLSVKEAFRLAWNEARLALRGVPAPDLRKG